MAAQRAGRASQKNGIECIEAKKMGLKIFTSETNKYSKSVTYEEIIEGMRQGKYKMTYTDIRLEAEIIFL